MTKYISTMQNTSDFLTLGDSCDINYQESDYNNCYLEDVIEHSREEAVDLLVISLVLEQESGDLNEYLQLRVLVILHQFIKGDK